jgi:hypothetical protein
VASRRKRYLSARAAYSAHTGGRPSASSPAALVGGLPARARETLESPSVSRADSVCRQHVIRKLDFDRGENERTRAVETGGRPVINRRVKRVGLLTDFLKPTLHRLFLTDTSGSKTESPLFSRHSRVGVARNSASTPRAAHDPDVTIRKVVPSKFSVSAPSCDSV